MSMRERKRNVKIRQSWQSNNSHWNVAIISLPSLKVVRLSQVIDIDLLSNIEITAEQVSFEWSHHSWFLFNDSIDREQNSTLHGSVISIFSSLFDCKLSEFDTNCKILFTLGFQLLGKKWLFWIDCTLWEQYKWWWSLSLDGNMVFLFLSYKSNNSHDKSGLFTNHFQFRNNSLVSKREVCRKVKVKHDN